MALGQGGTKVYFNSGAARSGTNFNTVGVAWQHRWGAGL
jgi:hypothetical protein